MASPILNDGRPLDVFRSALAAGRQPVPLAALIGFRVTEIEAGRAVVEMEAGDQHANIIGTLHGGIIATLADSAMGLAYAATLEAGERATSVDLRVNFLRPVGSGAVRAVSSVIRRGRTLGYIECDVFDAENRLVARASSTCMTIR